MAIKGSRRPIGEKLMSIMDCLNAGNQVDPNLVMGVFDLTEEEYSQRMTCLSPSGEMIADPITLEVYGLWMDGDEGLAVISWNSDCFDEQGYRMALLGGYCEFDHEMFRRFMDDLSSFYDKSMKQFEDAGLFDE
jgi:hypothetical protein